jgi:hypothetical protein
MQLHLEVAMMPLPATGAEIESVCGSLALVLPTASKSFTVLVDRQRHHRVLDLRSATRFLSTAPACAATARAAPSRRLYPRAP